MGTDGSNVSSSSANDLLNQQPSQSDGIIARAVYDLFKAKAALQNGAERVKITMSYLEIYNEQAIDLLVNNKDDDADSSSAPTILQVRDSKDGVTIPNLTHHSVSCPNDVTNLIHLASKKRATGSTNMNSVSSRSHAICTLNVSIAPNDSIENEGGGMDDDDNSSPRSLSSSDQNGMKAKLTLVDLAGSERMKRTGAEGARMKEGININKGLFVLGQVVSALSEIGQRSGSSAHIPYRDSKLTRLLQDSLGGKCVQACVDSQITTDVSLTRILILSTKCCSIYLGNSKTVMVACISPAESNIEESTNTLRYAERTRNIKNSAIRNVVSTGGLSATEAASLRRENQQLKLQLARMESSMIVSNSGGRRASTAPVNFSFGRPSSSDNIMETSSSVTTQLQGQCSSLLAEIEVLKSRAKMHTDEVLEASLRADKWQLKYESLQKLAQSQGLDMSGLKGGEDDATTNLVSQLRHQLAEVKSDLLDSRTETVVARATAGALLAGSKTTDEIGSNIHDIMVSSEEDSGNLLNDVLEDEGDDSIPNEQLTTELSEVSSTIEQKEAIVLQMEKERACRDQLQLNFESSLKLLMTEVDALTAERDELMIKMSSNNNEKESNSQTTNQQQQRRRKAASNNDPRTKRYREQISKLEERISALNVKANEHKRSMRMKEEAEKKCNRLLAEIADDKRRRADLQRKLKESSVERRAEQKDAKQKAAKMMKDSQRLKIELAKMKNAATKQALVLKRKIDQHNAKERARIEMDKKRQSVDKMRRSASSMDNSGVKEVRKAELSQWIDRELEYSLIKAQVNDQRQQLNKAIKNRKELTKNAATEDLEQLDTTIRSLKKTVTDLDMTVKKAFPASSMLDTNSMSTFRFLENDTFKCLSKQDAKFVLSYLFDASSSVRQEMTKVVTEQEALVKSSVDSALAKEQQFHSKAVSKIKLDHAENTLLLLESTQDTVRSNIKLKMNSSSEGTGGDNELKEQVDAALETYNKSWTTTSSALQLDLNQIKESQEELQTMMDDIAKGMTTVVAKKVKAKKKKVAVQHDYDSEAFESEESFCQDDGGEDSEYEPTPAKTKRKRRSPRLAKKKAAVPDSPCSPIGSSFVDDIDNKKVHSLKKACKKLGVPVTGKKHELKQRVREHILNNSMALPNHAEEEEEEGEHDDSVNVASAAKKVNFEVTELPPEFQPIEKEDCVKKKLWNEENSAAVKPPPRTPTSSSNMRSPKRKRYNSDDGAEQEEKDSSVYTPSKRTRLGFNSSSPRPFSSHNAQENTPAHLKQT